MKNIIIALALTVVSSASFANGFSPWEDRVAVQDKVESTGYTNSVSIGFAPWQERDNADVFANEHGVAMEIKARNIFRPWS